MEQPGISGLDSLADLGRKFREYDAGASACCFTGRLVDYETFDRHADQVANGLIRAGIRPGDRVALLARNSDAYLEIVIGAIRARATPVALNWRLAPPEIRYILEHSQARALFLERDLPASREFEDEIGWRGEFECELDPVLGGEYFDWRDAQANNRCALLPEVDDDVVQMYTSGTTGRPKGVCLSHRNYLAMFRQIEANSWGRWGVGERVFAPSPFFHVAGLNLALRALAQGACVFTVASFEPKDLPEIIESQAITRTVMVPAIIRICVTAPNAATTDFSSLKSVSYGGSPITQDLLRKAKATMNCEFVQGYGLTETTGVVTFLQPEDHLPEKGKLTSCGRPVEGGSVRIVDADGSDCPPGVVGEVLFLGPNVMSRYWNDPKATRESFSEGWFHTGDAGYLDSDGYLYIHDRVKDMIVSGAENIYPAEVENALADHQDVDDVAVIGVPDEKWGEVVKAIVVVRPGSELTSEALIQFARERIAGYKVPKSVDFVKQLPRNASGKILRRELRAPYWESVGRMVN